MEAGRAPIDDVIELMASPMTDTIAYSDSRVAPCNVYSITARAFID